MKKVLKFQQKKYTTIYIAHDTVHIILPEKIEKRVLYSNVFINTINTKKLLV